MRVFAGTALAASQALGAINSALNWVSAMAVLLLMLITTADAMSRYFLNRPVPGAYETSELAMVVVVFLALAATQASKGHIRVELLLRHVPPRLAPAFDVLAYVAGAVLFGLVTWRAGGWAWSSWQIREYAAGPAGVPMYPAKFALVAGAALFSLRYLEDAIRRFADLLRAE